MHSFKSRISVKVVFVLCRSKYLQKGFLNTGDMKH